MSNKENEPDYASVRRYQEFNYKPVIVHAPKRSHASKKLQKGYKYYTGNPLSEVFDKTKEIGTGIVTDFKDLANAGVGMGIKLKKRLTKRRYKKKSSKKGSKKHRRTQRKR
jgi:hypothetical protein